MSEPTQQKYRDDHYELAENLMLSVIVPKGFSEHCFQRVAAPWGHGLTFWECRKCGEREVVACGAAHDCFGIARSAKPPSLRSKRMKAIVAWLSHRAKGFPL